MKRDHVMALDVPLTAFAVEQAEVKAACLARERSSVLQDGGELLCFEPLVAFPRSVAPVEYAAFRSARLVFVICFRQRGLKRAASQSFPKQAGSPGHLSRTFKKVLEDHQIDSAAIRLRLCVVRVVRRDVGRLAGSTVAVPVRGGTLLGGIRGQDLE
ncbi:hypothetical protein AB852_36475 [Streptomyces uncialis]|uniref:Uncharacterized protein n=1 Tax=Streptomyces uncialis TaxID=1048205 RepID=A0A1Q4USB5_9ACTN|nr:hypothetical protein AB852_36475 [Streptomyces uncialis]